MVRFSKIHSGSFIMAAPSVSNITFASQRLAGMGKQGILKPNASGYYTMPFGALNTFNSAGAYYTANEAIKLFQESSILQRRIKDGCLFAEMGHPKRLPGMTDDDFLMRLHTIEETLRCAHISKIELDFDFGKKNPRFSNPAMIGIIGTFTPAGPYAESLTRSLQNGQENVCFSIRSLTRDFYQRGKIIKVLDTVFNWDCVTEPGIDCARKWDSAGLESVAIETDARVIQLDTFRKLIDQVDQGRVSMESTVMKNVMLEAYHNASRQATPMIELPNFQNLKSLTW